MIGTNVLGTAAIPNVGDGILIENSATTNTVGGTTTAARNILSGNTLCGIQIYGNGSSGNIIEGDYIGTDAGGSNPVPNGTTSVLTAGDGVLINKVRHRQHRRGHRQRRRQPDLGQCLLRSATGQRGNQRQPGRREQDRHRHERHEVRAQRDSGSERWQRRGCDQFRCRLKHGGRDQLRGAEPDFR